MLLSPSSKSRTYTGLVKMGEPARFRRTPGFCPRLYGHGSTRLKLSQAPEHRQHEAAMRGCRVRPCALKRTEAGLRLRHRVQHIEQVPRRSRQPIKPRHDQHAAGLDFCRRRYQPKRPPIANNRPGNPEFAQERDNRSKKAKFIFREIGSIRDTRLSPFLPDAARRSPEAPELWRACGISRHLDFPAPPGWSKKSTRNFVRRFCPYAAPKAVGGYVEQCLLHRPMTSKPEESFRDHTIWSALSMSGSNQHFMRINLRRMELSAV